MDPPPISSQDAAFFEKNVRPLLESHCMECHSVRSGKRKGGLLLDSREGITRGGDSGPALEAGRPDKSRIVLAVSGRDPDLRMPPKKTLDPTSVEILVEWVRRGAPDPREGDARPHPKYGMSLEEGLQFWAFRPLTRPELPAPTPGKSASHPVDRFVLEKIAHAGLETAPPADKRTLIRRAAYDLTGLPPTPRQVEAFLADASPQAFDTVVEEFLASPAYGERWGRHWMDVVRYADTCGNASDYPVPQLRLYRDWVIRALNEDMPYDRFVREQIAGDLIPGGTQEERNARVIATGYLALARRFAGKAGAPHLTIEDTIDNLSKAFLGVTLACARCHDHKFDPFTMRDYYALYGFFSSTRYPYPGAEGDTRQSQFVSLLEPAAVENLLAPYRDRIAAAEAEVKRLDEEHAALVKAAATGDSAVLEETKARLTEAKKKVTQLRADPPVLPDAYAVVDAPEAGDACIQNRGEPKNLGDKVRRGFPAVLGGMELDRDAGGSGRQALSEWVSSASNPLTARVMVNRVWMHHFGRGIVPTPNDFGKQGTPPTHPELLDFLAAEFIRSGWSLKTLHRVILSSETWKRSSETTAGSATKDPLNLLLSRQNRHRLDAEALRDTLLHLAGSMQPGPAPEHPFPPRNTWKWTQHNPFRESYDSKYRSVYLMQARLKRNAYLALFDGPDPSSSTGMRSLTTTPLQALFTLNHPLLHDSARAIATKTERHTASAERISATYSILFQRVPTGAEQQAAGGFLERFSEALGSRPDAPPPEAWAALTRSLLCSNELLFLD